MLVLSAPAKINLYLHITGKRADGYHTLDTVFQRIDLHDTVTLKLRADGAVVLHTPICGLADADHLAVRAAVLLKSNALGLSSNHLGVDIWIKKRIPTGAGMGGGSSDAATTLLGLNQLWGCHLDRHELQNLGLKLGADVPFFCSQFATAHATGIGEVLATLPTIDKAFIIVYPNCHVSTPAVFQHPQLVWSVDRDAGLPRYMQAHTAFATGLANDLQAPAQLLAPAIHDAMVWLHHAPQCEGVRMTGSGSAVFAQFANKALARAALLSLNKIKSHLNGSPTLKRPDDWTVLLAKTA